LKTEKKDGSAIIIRSCPSRSFFSFPEGISTLPPKIWKEVTASMPLNSAFIAGPVAVGAPRFNPEYTP
jgi:hypothetical protein